MSKQLPLARSLVSQTIDCSDYRSGKNSKRCQHYLSNGSCSRSDRFMCQEWMKVNGYDFQMKGQALPKPLASPSNGLMAPKPLASPKLEADPILTLQLLNQAHVTALKEQALEVCLVPPELGELWLVPEYTQQDRTELQFDHAATLTAICSVFPGARVRAIKPKVSVEPVFKTNP